MCNSRLHDTSEEDNGWKEVRRKTSIVKGLSKGRAQVTLGFVLIILAIFMGLIVPTIDPRAGASIRNSIINWKPLAATITIQLSATPTTAALYQRVTFTGSTIGLADGTQLDIYVYLGGDVHQGGGTNPYALSVWVYGNAFSTSAAVYLVKEGTGKYVLYLSLIHI